MESIRGVVRGADRMAAATRPHTIQALRESGVSRRGLLQVIGAGAGAAVLTGCGPLSSGGGEEEDGDGSGSQAAEIGVKPAEGTSGYDFLVAVGDSVTEANPEFTYTYTFVNTKVRPQIEQRWRAGNPPDTDYEVFNAQVPATHDFVENLLDLTPYMDEEVDGGGSWRDSFVDGAILETELDGKIYGVVTDTSLVALFYNIQIFDDLGLTPPATWDELLEVSSSLINEGIDPIAVTGMYEPYMGMWLDYLFQRAVGYEVARDAAFSGDYADPSYLSAAERFQELRDQGAFLNGFQGTDFTAVQMEFFQGNAAMILMGTWLTAEMQDSIPEDFQLGVAPFPQLEEGGEDNSFTSASNIMVVNKDSQSIDAAIAYMRRLTSVETQTARAAEQNAVSAVEGVPGPPGVEGFEELFANAGELNYRYFGTEFVPDRHTAYYREVARFFFGEQDAAQFIDSLTEAMSQDF
ncbi:MAG TPA: extracellular solute-binding protein [Candidatus Ruania gallistercoris]|uniref:Extracellular solute-binding protein n=1 Tax=Candidatus Ruania gallistercoris TaxID=2838746 RepID=A0A9D2J5P9_9MICO|nr:extracellular solute-binding protein [Candidatus Ruania gallistercoris]